VAREKNGLERYGDDNFLKSEFDCSKEILEELADAFNLTCMAAERDGGHVPTAGMIARLCSMVSGEDRPLLVYISGPYSDDRERRAHEARSIAQQVMVKGHIPITPHSLFHNLDHDTYVGQTDAVDLTYETFLEATLELLALCDLVFFIGCSPGAGKEWVFAKRIGKPIVYKLEDIPCRSWTSRLLDTLNT